MNFKEIAEIKSGFQFRKGIEHDPNGDVKVIQMKDVRDDLSINTSSLIRCFLGNKKDQKYLIKKGDILFKAKGSTNQAGVLIDDIGDVIASSQFLVIKPDKERVLPLYLAWFINQAYQNGYFKQVREGTYIPFISKKTLGDMNVPIPSIDIQKRIIRLYILQLREKELLDQLLQKRNKLIKRVIHQQLKIFK